MHRTLVRYKLTHLGRKCFLANRLVIMPFCQEIISVSTLTMASNISERASSSMENISESHSMLTIPNQVCLHLHHIELQFTNSVFIS